MFRFYLSVLPFIPIIIFILISNYLPLGMDKSLNTQELTQIIFPYIIFSLSLNILLPKNFLEKFTSVKETNSKQTFIPVFILFFLTFVSTIMIYGTIPILSMQSPLDIINFNSMNTSAPSGFLGLLLTIQILIFALELGREKLIPLNILVLLLSTILIGKRQFLAAFIISLITRYFFFNKKLYLKNFKTNITPKFFIKVLLSLISFGFIFGLITSLRFGTENSFQIFNIENINNIFIIFCNQIRGYVYMPLVNSLFLYNENDYPGIISGVLFFISYFLPYGFKSEIYQLTNFPSSYPMKEIGAGGMAEMTYAFSIFGPIIIAIFYAFIIRQLIFLTKYKPFIARGLLLWLCYITCTLFTYNLAFSLPFGLIPFFIYPFFIRKLQKRKSNDFNN